MAKRTDKEKILFDDYVSVSTIQRYFGKNKMEAEDIFIKVQQLDEENGYLRIYDNKVRSEAVFALLGLNLEIALKRYEIRNRGS